MQENLILRTGVTNIQNISIASPTDKMIQGTTPSEVTIETIPITLQNINSSVLLSGSIDFDISDTATGTVIGPLLLDIIRVVDGTSTLIYETGYNLEKVNYEANMFHLGNLSFEWLDSNPLSSLCPSVCPNSSIDCPGTTITYNFVLSNDIGFATATQTAGIDAGSFYSLTVAEVLK
ncbi:hypothetical protein IRP63_08460 [Clostridium botulinum]|uniref:Uncharacterized protein n=1 Tax=Clostridium botulinum C/D str. DC5 TaxID=1443128 RepID=A0A0A0ICI8_CLOBO|nr:hypothetical protein [Clostridium botulinum]KGM98647.1 hypothetical protein Z955_10810 [Clostridium botulinum C/D str. DC5]KOC50047.1 hypothetical protein ADU89_14950 [Clostridium botulinum]KOC52218.1 hypothetical protein ADU90_14735 [Clostridium botulinum]MCD3235117.1 hypothetical protein [Clostridium botulinum D/C]MCD3241056.1 hypothetical protein [Clostridium botulinum D/C]